MFFHLTNFLSNFMQWFLVIKDVKDVTTGNIVYLNVILTTYHISFNYYVEFDSIFSPKYFFTSQFPCVLESVLVRTVQARRWRRHRVRGGRYPPPSSVLGPSLSLYCPDTRKLLRRDSVHIPLRALHSEENISSSKCSINQLRNNHYELSNTTLVDISNNHQTTTLDIWQPHKLQNWLLFASANKSCEMFIVEWVV